MAALFVLLFLLSSLSTAAYSARQELTIPRGEAHLHRRQTLSLLLLNALANVGIVSLFLGTVGFELLATRWEVQLAFAGLVLLLLVVGELMPRMRAASSPEYTAQRLRWFIGLADLLFLPLSGPVAFLLGKIMRQPAAPSREISSETLRVVADMAERTGTLHEEERALLDAVADFGETTVREIMTSRVDTYALPSTSTVRDALALIREAGHSRYPVYRDHLDFVVGVLHAKDLLPSLEEEDALDRPVSDFTREPYFVPETKRLNVLMRDFRSLRQQMAIVVDEYGGTAGLVTMEDLLEEIVGDIRDERDDDELPLFTQLEERLYRLDARINLDDLNEELDLDLPTEEFDFDTLGGLILNVMGTIPKPGDRCTYGVLEMTIESVKHHRIGMVLTRITTTDATKGAP